MTDTSLYADGDRTAIRIERRLGHPPEKVWRALTEPSHLNQWFPFDVEPELVVGGAVRFAEKGEGQTLSGKITELDPPRVIAYTWEEDHLRWEVRPSDGGSLLVLTHTVADHYGSASFATGWHACIDGMLDVLAGRPVADPDRAAMDAGHERFIGVLGLDAGTVDNTGEGWRVRFERQLVRPAEAAWAALVGPSVPVVGGPVPDGCLVAEFAAGPVAESRAGEALAYDWLFDGAPAGGVRIELGQGTGHGARLVLTQTGPADRTAERDAALKLWRDRIERLAADLAVGS
ncbi:hypothetical protein GCM10023321_77220 [Pseudonocardia eucalypti]|uniref:Activator of Hsp90 ATPase homologue 1/2-like C-terminal domain-containing protein n=1 Tax=Pseudonocardia eucalypti TaxID=648755 RepID=A0ABP9RBJ5_9PSEU|nr:uncharacterized protein YndB with AHSA1/START domain [Pseudonocardia eucalypti]